MTTLALCIRRENLIAIQMLLIIVSRPSHFIIRHKCILAAAAASVRIVHYVKLWLMWSYKTIFVHSTQKSNICIFCHCSRGVPKFAEGEKKQKHFLYLVVLPDLKNLGNKFCFIASNWIKMARNTSTATSQQTLDDLVPNRITQD